MALVIVMALPALLGGCAGATVVERSDAALTLRWDEREVAAARVAQQAVDLCSAHGFNARRAFAVADDVEGAVHTTRYICRGLPTGALPKVL